MGLDNIFPQAFTMSVSHCGALSFTYIGFPSGELLVRLVRRALRTEMSVKQMFDCM